MDLSARYELLEEVGRGASGVVYRAKEIGSGREVAVKIVRPALGQQSLTPQQQERLRREAKILARIQHPSVVEVMDAVVEPEGAYLITEFVHGESLQDILVRRGRLAVAEAVSLVVQAAHALAAAHRHGVVHRDVKPANLLVDVDGRLKIVDFGVAWEPAGESRPQGGEYLMGTPAYVAPEQLQGAPVDGRADLYSLAVVLFRCLTGERPFEGRSVGDVIHRVLHEDAPPPSVHRPDLPEELDLLCRQALARDPEKRPAGVVDFARALERISVPPLVGGEPGYAGARGAEDPGIERTCDQREASPPRFRRRRAGILLAFLLVTGLWFSHHALQSPGPSRGEKESEAREGGDHGIEVGSKDAPWRLALRAACPDASSTSCREAWARILAADANDEEAFRMLSEAGERVRAASESHSAAGAKARPQRTIPVPSPRREAPSSAKRTAIAIAVPSTQPRERPPEPLVSSPEPAAAAMPTAAPPAPPVHPRPRPASRTISAPVPSEVVMATGRIDLEHDLEEGMMEIRVDGRRVSLVPLDARSNGGHFTVSPGRHVLSLRVMSATKRIDVERRWKQAWVRGENAQRRFALRREPGSRSWSLERIP